MSTKLEKIQKEIGQLPQTPGVYFFLTKENKKQKISYIGKATSLRSRVRSYFASDILEKRGPLIQKMMQENLNIKFEQTDSVLEALLLEAELIRKHQPLYNTIGKDQKSFNFVVITKEDFPRIFIERERTLDFDPEDYQIDTKFGPFPSGRELQEALKIIRRIFPYRDKKCFLPVANKPLKPCFNYGIELCPGTCIGAISKADYKKTIRNIKLFFQGKKRVLIRQLTADMKECAKLRKFEEAEKIKRQLFALKHINDIALVREKYNGLETRKDLQSFRIEAYDISHMSGANIVGVMTVVENGEAKKQDYRKFNIRGQKGADDTKALKEILERRFTHAEWNYPDLVVIDGGQAQFNAAEKTLEILGQHMPLVSVLKDEKHKPKEILGDPEFSSPYKKDILLANSESHRFAIAFHRKKRSLF